MSTDTLGTRQLEKTRPSDIASGCTHRGSGSCGPETALPDSRSVASAPVGHAPEALPRSLDLLIRNARRAADQDDIIARAVAAWRAGDEAGPEIEIGPTRILMQDTAGIAALVDLAALRDFAAENGTPPERIEPQVAIDLVIDHSVSVDLAGSGDAAERNLQLEFSRNAERYAFFRWAEKAFRTLNIVPPGNGICHQINLEQLANVATRQADGVLIPELLIGTDSHTTMVNALGVLGWGVGGIEAEAVALGQTLSMRLPNVTAIHVTGRREPGISATDIALTLTATLRDLGVVGHIVEVFGPGLDDLTLADRATLANMAPEYGATCTLFPVDDETLAYLRRTGRDPAHIRDTEQFAKDTGLWRGDEHDRAYSRVVEFDLASVRPTIAGPGRPHQTSTPAAVALRYAPSRDPVEAAPAAAIAAGAVAIASITSCTNTANPDLMIAAGLACRKARKLGLKPKPWVKTSFSPGSRATAALLRDTGLQEDMDALGFQVTGFGCMTCVGNSGRLKPEMDAYLDAGGRDACAILSGNRNFEFRIHNRIADNYLMSPARVVLGALAGTMAFDPAVEPLGLAPDGSPIHAHDILPSEDEVARLRLAASADGVQDQTRASNALWDALPAPDGSRFPWVDASAAIRRPPFFNREAPLLRSEIVGARPLLVLGDNVTTDHISPIGRITAGSPAGRWLETAEAAGLESYGACRGNHEVMMRGTFAHPGLRNALAGERAGPWTAIAGEDGLVDVFEAAGHYAATQVPLVVFAGANYGMGSARDWAAKGTLLLGVRAVIAESFERIHRANLAGVGVLPLQLPPGTTCAALGIRKDTTVTLRGLGGFRRPGMSVTMILDTPGEAPSITTLTLRLDTAREVAVAEKGGLFSVAGELAAKTNGPRARD
nr:aconitate hydratase [uncultured bacterium]